MKKNNKVNLDNTEYGRDQQGNIYIIDVVNKTCKKFCSAPKTMSFDESDAINIPEIGLDAYRNYLRDRFMDEDCPIKKGKLYFRGYRVSLTVESGFVIEDTTKHYEIVDTPFEGIPTPEELGDWFDAPKTRELSDDEKLQEHLESVEAGKRDAYNKKREREHKQKELEKLQEELENIDFEKYRSDVLEKIAGLRAKTSDFELDGFKDYIPFKRWRRKTNALLKKMHNKEIRIPKFLNLLEEMTKEETFVVEEKRHRSSFKGTLMPEHNKVGYLKGDKLEVDDKLVDAVPFLVEYLLNVEPRCMSQLMKWAKGEITDKELLEDPMKVDWKVEYSKRVFKNSAHNAQILSMVFDIVGWVAPQDLLFESDLKEGDVILLMVDGELKRRTVASTYRGVTVGKDVGLLKTDRYVLAPKKEQ